MNASELADETARRLHGLLNEERRKRDLQPLEGNQELIRVAQNYSRTMARRGTIGHNIDGQRPEDRAPARFSYVSENVAKTHRQSNPGRIAHGFRDQWMNSKPHRENLLNSRSRYDGIGIWVDGNEVYATHLMAGSRMYSPVGDLVVAFAELAITGFWTATSAALATPKYVKNGIERLSPNRKLSIRERQLLYGFGYGGAALGFGLLIESEVFTSRRLIPDLGGSLLTSVLTPWNPPTELSPAWIEFIYRRLTDPVGAVLVIAGMISAESISDTGRLQHLLQNSGAVALGFGLLGLIIYATLIPGSSAGAVFGFLLTGLVAGAIGGGLIWIARHTPY